MEKITAKSKKSVVELLNPGPNYERVRAPRHLTIRRLLGYQRYQTLLSRYAFAVIEGNRLVCLSNLQKLGFDYVG